MVAKRVSIVVNTLSSLLWTWNTSSPYCGCLNETIFCSRVSEKWVYAVTLPLVYSRRPTIRPTNSNIDIFSETVSNTAMKLGTMIIWIKAHRNLPVWMTFVQGHGHRGWLKILKSQTIVIFSDKMTTTAMKLGTMLLFCKALQAMCQFESRSRLKGLIENLQNSNTDIFQTLWPLQSWNLA